MDVDDDLKYSYSSKPRAVQTSRAKSAGKLLPPNIMHDPRVMRGSMFAGRHGSGAPGKAKAKSIYEAQKVASYTFTPFSLEANLVEQLPAVPERDSGSQTDAFAARKLSHQKGWAPDGEFLRPKVGVDSSTQIEDADKLFNFDVEARPLLNVLVSKTIAQALAEVKEEQEMRNVRNSRKALLELKADAARADRELEQKAKDAQRLKLETERLKELQRQRRQVMAEKVCAWQIARTLVPQALARASQTLEDRGVFYDPLRRELQQWLEVDVYRDADVKVQLRRLSALLLDDVVANSIRRQTILSQLLHHESEAFVRLILKDPLRVPRPDTSGDADGGEATTQSEIPVIGPILISRQDSLDTIEHKIQAWIAENVGDSVPIPSGGYLSVLNLAGSVV
ncbi:hypothetical protein PybrP1_002369 [[Pythium] brassicae (nom. inval.)]|nr:hypothetical protein PybrP1_002369 [[Pythium] brassicae (nom. inval.)]